jgi:hypothetical protein
MTQVDDLIASEKILTAELISHEQIMDQLLKHETGILQGIKNLGIVQADVAEIKMSVAPMVMAISSSVFAFKALCYIGAGSVAVMGIIQLIEYVNKVLP